MNLKTFFLLISTIGAYQTSNADTNANLVAELEANFQRAHKKGKIVTQKSEDGREYVILYPTAGISRSPNAVLYKAGIVTLSVGAGVAAMASVAGFNTQMATIGAAGGALLLLYLQKEEEDAAIAENINAIAVIDTYLVAKQKEEALSQNQNKN